MKSIAFLILGFCWIPVLAQPSPPQYRAQVADSLVQSVFTHAYTLQQLRERVLQADAKVVQERLHWLSSLRVGVQFINLPGSQTYDPKLGVIPALGASVSLDLEGLATRRSRVQAAAAGRRIAQRELQQEKRALRVWVEGKYIEYLQLLDLLRLRADVLQGQEEQATLVRKRFERGEARLEEFLQISAAVTETKESLLRSTLEAHRVYRELVIAGSIEETHEIPGERR